MLCPRCNSEIKNASKYCSSCGAKLDEVKEQIKEDSNTFSQNAKIDTDRALIDAYIGPKSEKIKRSKFSVFAFLFGPLYYFYRKMYLEGFIIYIISFFSSMIIDDTGILGICISIYCGLTFRNHYLKHVHTKVENIKRYSISPHLDDMKEEARRKGGTTVVPVVIIVILYSLLIFLIIVLVVIIGVFESRYEEDEYIEYTPMTSKIEYDVPVGFYPDEYNTTYFSAYETEDSYCSFYVSSTTESDETSGVIEQMNLENSQTDEYGRVYINGLYWYLNVDITDVSATYELTTYKDGTNYKMSYFYITDEEHSYCEDAYKQVRDSLIIQ